MPFMRFLRFLAPTTVLVALATSAMVFSVAPTPAWAQSKYDGTWSVLIVTERGECDRAYRYGIRIQGGRILYDGEAGVSFTGRVEPNGQVTATVRAGDQGANGTGRLSGTNGSGRWQGRSGAGACGGRWEAERR